MGAGSHKSTVILEGKSDSLNAAAKSSAKELGKVEDSVARLEQQMRKATAQIDKQAATTKKLEDANKKLRSSNVRGADTLKQAGAQLQGWIATARQAVEIIDQLATRQLNLSNVQANLPFSIEEARVATQGLISDYDLMKQATVANRLGVAKTSTDFAKLAQTSTKLGISIGEDATQSLEDLTSGLGRGSVELLDNLGIILRAEDAHKQYAESVGKTVSQLTAVEKRQSVMNLGLERGAAAAAKAKVSTDSLGGAWAQATVQAQNYLDTILMVDENLAELSEETLKEFGANQKEAEEATDTAADALKIYGLSVLTLGTSNVFFAASAAIDEFGDSNEDMARTITRGAPSYNILIDFMNQTGTSGERAEKVLTKIGRAIGTLGDVRLQEEAAARAEVRELQSTQRFEAGRKTREKILKNAEERRKKNAKNAREAGEAMLQVQLDQATRSTKIIEDRVKAGTAATSELIGAIQVQAFHEQNLAELQFRHAQTSAERIRLVGGMEAAQAESDAAQTEARIAQVEQLEELAVGIADKQLARLEQTRAIAAVEAEIEASKALRGAEEIEDPLERMERETEIRLELIDVQLRAANEPIAQMQLADQQEAILHENKMERLDEERKERKKTQDTIDGIVNQATEMGIAAGQSLVQKVLFEKKSLRESVKNVAATEGAKQAIVGASELIRAAVAAASFNLPKAAQHAANAGTALAFAASMAATYGIASIGGGRGSGGGLSAGGFGGGTSQGGGAANGPGGSSSSPRSGTSPDIPNSPGPSPQTAAGQAAGQSTGPTIIIQGDVIGTPKPEFVQAIDKGLRDLQFGGRRVSNG